MFSDKEINLIEEIIKSENLKISAQIHKETADFSADLNSKSHLLSSARQVALASDGALENIRIEAFKKFGNAVFQAYEKILKLNPTVITKDEIKVIKTEMAARINSWTTNANIAHQGPTISFPVTEILKDIEIKLELLFMELEKKNPPKPVNLNTLKQIYEQKLNDLKTSDYPQAFSRLKGFWDYVSKSDIFKSKIKKLENLDPQTETIASQMMNGDYYLEELNDERKAALGLSIVKRYVGGANYGFTRNLEKDIKEQGNHVYKGFLEKYYIFAFFEYFQFYLIELANDQNQEEGKASNTINETYVDLERIKEIEALPNTFFDFSRLIQMLKELNNSFENNNFISVIFLVRAIIDHVPPLFGESTFDQFCANHGGKSFKDAMNHLQITSRKIANANLHIPIRKKESLPNKTQINFSQDLDILLAEIIRNHKTIENQNAKK